MEIENLNYYSDHEEKLNVLTHAFGLILSIVGLLFLLFKSFDYDSWSFKISFIVYGISLILLYTASTLYHYSQTPSTRMKLKVADHIAIYFLIAGTYTPFTLVTLEGKLGWTIFSITWALAFIGVIFKLFFIGRFNTVSTIAYVAMGWIIVFAIGPLVENLPTYGLCWLLAGGICYTLGAVLYSLPKLKYNHAIFHVFVLLGSFAHFVAVYFYV